MGSESSVEIAFLIILIVLFLQSAGLAFALSKASRSLESMERRIDRISSPLVKTLGDVDEALERIVPVTRRLPAMEAKLRGASSKLLEAARESDERMEALIEQMHEGAKDVDRQIDEGLQGFSRHSYQVHQAILHPSRELSAAFAAVASTIRGFFSRDSSLGPEFVAEEEDFV